MLAGQCLAYQSDVSLKKHGQTTGVTDDGWVWLLRHVWIVWCSVVCDFLMAGLLSSGNACLLDSHSLRENKW